jgi:uncharacterized protein (TIGR03435 family)
MDERESALALMLQALLAERFHLTLHRESVTVPAYDLVVIGSRPRITPDKPNDPDLPRGFLRVTSGHIVAQGVPIERLANALEIQMQRPVEDKTGLTGSWDFSLTWQPVESLAATPESSDTQQLPLAPEDTSMSPISVALEDQLRLRLKPSTTIGQVLVVDHVDKPISD